MKETDLLNLIKQSEDNAEAIINEAQIKINELKGLFEEKKKNVQSNYEQNLSEEIEKYRSKKESEFRQLLERLNEEKEQKISKLINDSNNNFDKVLKEITSSILEQRWQLKK